ncbi:MAG: hypothetical protein K1V80_06305 [Muribaculaceae bacterium]
MADINRITLMIKVEDVARADIMITPERTYYRFATDASIEDGELAAVENFNNVVSKLIDAAIPLDDERPLPENVKLQVFVNNRLSPEKPTEESLRRVINAVAPLSPEFSFIEGFK